MSESSQDSLWLKKMMTHWNLKHSNKSFYQHVLVVFQSCREAPFAVIQKSFEGLSSKQSHFAFILHDISDDTVFPHKFPRFSLHSKVTWLSYVRNSALLTMFVTLFLLEKIFWAIRESGNITLRSSDQHPRMVIRLCHKASKKNLSFSDTVY